MLQPDPNTSQFQNVIVVTGIDCIMGYASEGEMLKTVRLKITVVTTKHRRKDKFSPETGTEGADSIYGCGVG